MSFDIAEHNVFPSVFPFSERSTKPFLKPRHWKVNFQVPNLKFVTAPETQGASTL